MVSVIFVVFIALMCVQMLLLLIGSVYEQVPDHYCADASCKWRHRGKMAAPESGILVFSFNVCRLEVSGDTLLIQYVQSLQEAKNKKLKLMCHFLCT